MDVWTGDMEEDLERKRDTGGQRETERERNIERERERGGGGREMTGTGMDVYRDRERWRESDNWSKDGKRK